MTEWKQTIRLGDIFRNEALAFLERRDAIVSRLRNSSWVKNKDEFDELPQYIEELANADTDEAYESAMHAIYDEADADRVWLDGYKR